MRSSIYWTTFSLTPESLQQDGHFGISKEDSGHITVFCKLSLDIRPYRLSWKPDDAARYDASLAESGGCAVKAKVVESKGRKPKRGVSEDILASMRADTLR